MGPQFPYAYIWLENGPLRASFCLGPPPLRAPRAHIYATGKDFFARQLVQEENMGHLYNLGNLGVLSSVFIGDLHGITFRGNRGITAVETAVMGNGFSLSRRKRR